MQQVFALDAAEEKSPREAQIRCISPIEGRITRRIVGQSADMLNDR